MQAEEIQLNAGARRLAGLAWGDPDATPLLALHGWMDHAGSFATLAPLLGSCRTVALDLPGHGFSSLDPGAHSHQFLDGVGVIHEALLALGWERAYLMGHSMGAGLALLYAAAFPERLRGLISIDMLGPMSASPGEFTGRLRHAVEARVAYREERRHFKSRDEAVAARVKPDLGKRGADLLAERGLEQTPAGWTWRGDRRLKLPSLSRLSEHQVRAALRSADIPVLVIKAQGKRPAALEQMFQERLKELPQASPVTLPGGHHLHLENPGPCAAVILQFLAATPDPVGL